MSIKPINKYLLVRVDKPNDRIGSIVVPEIGQGRTNSGIVVELSDKIEPHLSIGERVWFMEYKNSIWLDNEYCIIPYYSLNAKENKDGIFALGSKTLVKIDKQKQKSNRFIGSIKLLIPDFNNEYLYFNQFGECISVGPHVKENVVPGDIALINQFVETTAHALIVTLDNGDELRVVETGTTFNYEWYGYIHESNIISTDHYVFVEEAKDSSLEGLTQLKSGLLLIQPEKSAYDTKRFTVKHNSNDGCFIKGDVVLAPGKSAKIGILDIFYIHRELVKENLHKMLNGVEKIEFNLEKIIIEQSV